MKAKIVLAGIVVGSLWVSNACADIITYDMGMVANTTYASSGMINGSSFPSTDQTFSGVDFAMTGEIWHSQYDTDRTLTLSLNIFGVESVYSLLSTFWGVDSSSGSYLSIEFIGSDNAYQSIDLYGNVDIRDYHQGGYTNNLTSPTAQEVWNTGSGQRIDMQTFALDASFLDESLTSIVITDTGWTGYQSAFLGGITFETSGAGPSPVPEPTTMLLLGSGLGYLAGSRIRRKQREKNKY